MKLIFIYVLLILLNCTADRPNYKNNRNPIHNLQNIQSTDDLFKKKEKEIPIYRNTEEKSIESMNDLWDFSLKFPSTKIKAK